MAEENTGAAAEHDHRLRQTELVISHVLRGGVIASAAVILLGVLWFYLQMAITGHAALGYPHTFGGIIRRLAHGEPLALVALGLLILLLTPILRVAISIVVFALEHDWRYTIITALVLVILLISLVLGRGGA
ncbi:MAG TPA: DUF1634 domain-containing protein [Ktedonobacterales bacterium]|nr:DUF1634 domain-containing protein [Ktedonobacterales bacterium]